MYRVRQLTSLALLLLLTAPAIAADERENSTEKAEDDKKLTRAIEQILGEPDVARGFWGIDVVSLDTGSHLSALNENKLFTPASNTKLFTTAAVFALIGPDYRFKTTVESLGTVDKYGRLNSDLVVVGRGDPNLSGRTLPYYLHTERKAPPIQVLIDLADQLVQKGLKFVDGDVVADDSYYVFERYGEGWSQDDLVWEWGAPVSALTINDNVLFVSIMPADRPGERAFLNITPFPEYYRIDNRVMTTPQGTGPRKIYINREPGSNQITFWGNMPQDDAGTGEALAIEDPADFTAKLFRELLEQRGVTVYGRPRTRHTELASMQTFTVTSIASGGGGEMAGHPNPAPLVLASHESQPLCRRPAGHQQSQPESARRADAAVAGQRKRHVGLDRGWTGGLARIPDLGRHQARSVRVLRRLGPVARKPGHSRSGGRVAAICPATALGQALRRHLAGVRE